MIISWPTGISTTFTVNKKQKRNKIIVKYKGQRCTLHKKMQNYEPTFNHMEYTLHRTPVT
jgi:hypothetical protein